MSVSLSSGGGNYTTIVTRAVAKAHLRVDGSDEDSLIDELINAAGERAETVTNRQFYTATRVLRMQGFSDERYRRPESTDIMLPFPPLASVSSVVYTDTSGTTQTWNSTNYLTDTNSETGRIRPAYQQTYPSTRDSIYDTVVITYTCGYGTNATNTPSAIRQGMLLQIGSMYKFREDILSGMTVTQLPDNDTALGLWAQERVLEIA